MQPDAMIQDWSDAASKNTGWCLANYFELEPGHEIKITQRATCRQHLQMQHAPMNEAIC